MEFVNLQTQNQGSQFILPRYFQNLLLNYPTQFEITSLFCKCTLASSQQKFLRHSQTFKQGHISTMVPLCCRLNRFAFGKKMVTQIINPEPRHGSTAHLWETGSGQLPERELLVSGWNVNGIRAVIRKNQLMPFLQKQKPDWLCINETKMDYDSFQKQTKKLQFPPEYLPYWNFCKISSGYSGVLVLTPHRPQSIVEDIPGHEYHSLEGRVLTLEYQKFYLVNVYKPNAGKKLERLWNKVLVFEQAFLEYMRDLLGKKEVIIVGDMNAARDPIDITNYVQNKGKAGFTREQRNVFQETISLGFRDCFRELHPDRKQYTYWAPWRDSRKKNVGWRIDYIFASQKFNIESATIHDEVMGSDHCPISASFLI